MSKPDRWGPLEKPTQCARVLSALEEGPKDGAYFTYTMRPPIPEYRSRINQLRKAGHNIQAFNQKGSPYVLFVLNKDNQDALFAMEEEGGYDAID